MSQQPIRTDLALGAAQIAAKATDLSTAQAFAQTAVDFLTGDYEIDDDSPAYRDGAPPDAVDIADIDRAFRAGGKAP